ncbi:MAG: GIY-YIG nuclease family protein [Chloroflexi bacterium]|nr:GIY-YIG nuclease family protein [Chloroflexota bacterium]
MAGYLDMLRCADGSYYTGSTTNLEVRIAQHDAEEGGAYTFRKRPVKLVYSCAFPTLHDAFLRERQVKGWSRRKKEALMRGDFDAIQRLARGRRTD